MWPMNDDIANPADQGALIVLEGIDGSGTTTQAALLTEALRARGHRAHLTRQPSLGPIGQLIRAILRGEHRLPDGGAVDENTMALLFAADRMDHVQREVLPELDAGSLVVCSRWATTSARAYQIASLKGAGRGEAGQDERGRLRWLDELHDVAGVADIVPSLVLWLRCPPELAHQRRVAAGARVDRYDDLALQCWAAASYEQIMSYGINCATIDATLSVEQVHADVLDTVLTRIAGR